MEIERRNVDMSRMPDAALLLDRLMDAQSPYREPGALGMLRAAAQVCDRRVGLHRIGVVLSVAIIAIAVVVLYRILRDIDVHEVIEALVTTEWRDIALAALFVAGGYFTLTFYDLFALRTIGRRDVPYRIAALAGFTSYSVGHNVGASVFTGGAVRYRIYSAWGLSAVEVAKICFVAGLTFWLGNATVLGLGIAYAPQAATAIDQLPAWLNRAVARSRSWSCSRSMSPGSGAGRASIGRDGWQVTLPGGPLTLLQIGIGIVDLGFCALAMYMLVPAEPNIGFVTLAVIFVSATLLGFASHSPGGLGVFDAAMLVALWQFDKEELLAGLLLFRLLYYIVPFALSLLILGARESSGSRCGRGACRAWPATCRWSRRLDRRQVACRGRTARMPAAIVMPGSGRRDGRREPAVPAQARAAGVVDATAIAVGWLWLSGVLGAVPALAALWRGGHRRRRDRAAASVAVGACGRATSRAAGRRATDRIGAGRAARSGDRARRRWRRAGDQRRRAHDRARPCGAASRSRWPAQSRRSSTRSAAPRADGVAQRVEIFERVPVDRWYEVIVTPDRRAIATPPAGGLMLVTFHDLTPLRRVEEMRADFVANASHELRTPLAALSGFIETLQGPARDDAAARERFLEIMQAQATRMARLIDDLLSLSRIELNAHLRPDTQVDLAAIVRQVVDGLQTLARDRGVEVKVDGAGEAAARSRATATN